MKSSVAAFSYRPWHIQSLTRHVFSGICNQKSSNRPSSSSCTYYLLKYFLKHAGRYSSSLKTIDTKSEV